MTEYEKMKKQLSTPSLIPDFKQQTIPDYRRCPICWAGSGGYGVSYSTQGNKRYYRCVKTVDSINVACGHTWTAIVEFMSGDVVRVEHRDVRIQKR